MESNRPLGSATACGRPAWSYRVHVHSVWQHRWPWPLQPAVRLRKGIFIKSDEAIQQLTEVDAIVLDKTGTLTTGTMEVVDVASARNTLHSNWLCNWRPDSNHPVARALMRYRPTCGIGNS